LGGITETSCPAIFAALVQRQTYGADSSSVLAPSGSMGPEWPTLDRDDFGSIQNHDSDLDSII
jgi:hypothetical protein